MLRGTPQHPKTLALIRTLGVLKPHAVGLLELLWHFTATYAPAGDIGRWPDAVIEGACGWEGDSGALLAALVSCGWVDEHPTHRLLVHDWHEHSDRHVRRKLARHGENLIGWPKDGHGRPKGTRRVPNGHPVGGPAGAGASASARARDISPLTPHHVGTQGAPNGHPTGDQVTLPNGDGPEHQDPSGFLEALKARLSITIAPHAFATWFRPLERAWWDGDTFVIEAPDDQFQAWLRHNYGDQLKAALHELGQDCKVRLVVRAREPTAPHDGAL